MVWFQKTFSLNTVFVICYGKTELWHWVWELFLLAKIGEIINYRCKNGISCHRFVVALPCPHRDGVSAPTNSRHVLARGQPDVETGPAFHAFRCQACATEFDPDSPSVSHACCIVEGRPAAAEAPCGNRGTSGQWAGPGVGHRGTRPK